MAWNTFWNTGGLVLFISVVLLGIVPQNVKGRPQSSPVPTKVEDAGFNESVIENNRGDELQVPVKEEEEPVLINKSKPEVPTVSDLLESNDTPLPSLINETPKTEDKIIVSDFPGSRKSDFAGSQKSCGKTGGKSSNTINYDDLRAGLETGGVLLIDVRNRTELETTCKLPWSVNVPLHEVTEAFAMDANTFREKYGFPKPAPEDKNIVLTCRSGRRIKVARKIIEPLGYCNVKLYSGSWLDWKARGGPLFPVFRDGKLLPEKCP